VVWRRN